jgi:hypothetical protein
MMKKKPRQLDFTDYNIVAFDPKTHAEMVRKAVYAKPCRCLLCRKTFKSRDIRTNRICNPCKGGREYRNPAAAISYVVRA